MSNIVNRRSRTNVVEFIFIALLQYRVAPGAGMILPGAQVNIFQIHCCLLSQVE